MRDAGQGHDGRRYRFTHALVHEVVYQNLLLSRRTELHERAGRALEEAVGPSPSRLSDLEALGHHWSFTSDKAKGARYLTVAGDRSRAVYANDDAIRHYERALATLASCLACDDQIRIVRERLADLSGAHRTARRRSGALRGRAPGARGGGRRRGRGARSTARSAGCIGRRATASAPRRASPPASSGWAKRAIRSSAPSSSRRSVGSPFAPATMRAPSPGPSGRLPRRRGRTRLLPTASASARGRQRRPRPTTRWAWRSRGRASPEAVDRIEQSIALAEAHDLLQATCRGYTNLSVL